MKALDSIHLQELFSGEYALLFWGVQLLGLLIPTILLLFRQFRKPLPMMVIALFVLAGSWLKRILIVVPPTGTSFFTCPECPDSVGNIQTYINRIFSDTCHLNSCSDDNYNFVKALPCSSYSGTRRRRKC